MTMMNVYNEIQAALKRGERVATATVVKTIGAAPCGVGSKLLVRADGSVSGSFSGAQVDTQVAEKALRVLHPEPRLIIAGAGYVAQALARLVSQLDFRIVVVDDRRDLADPQAFGDRVQLTFGDIPETIRALEPDEASWIVIVTRGHHLDKDALRAALESNAHYVGMIGSPGKVKKIFRDLYQEGIPRERLARVHSPIGLDLGAETPDEIALSIAAEMVMLRKNGTGASLKEMRHLLDEAVPVEEVV